MTIVKNTSSLVNYPYQHVSLDVINQLRVYGRDADYGTTEVPLKLLECYCHITDQRISYPIRDLTQLHWVTTGFLGALQDPFFVSNGEKSRMKLKDAFFLGLEKLVVQDLKLEFTKRNKTVAGMARVRWELQKTHLNKEAVEYWSGWPISSQKTQTVYLSLANLWNSHGRDFTKNYHHHWKQFFAKMKRPGYSEVNQMAEYLSSNAALWPEDTFSHPIKIKRFFEAFMVDFFNDVVDRGLDISAQTKNWSRFIANVEEAFITPKVWATPFGSGLPKPVSRDTHLTRTRLRTNEDGTVVHEKLITSVPLHITDEQAIQILFSDISNDLKIVDRWAVSQIFELRRRQKARDLRIKYLNQSHGSQIEGLVISESERKILSAFARDGYNPDDAYINQNMGWKLKKGDLCNFLGIPHSQTLLPFMCILVSLHPEITTGFLHELELFDKSGSLTGFTKTDSSFVLTGFKHRADPPEKSIHLKPRAAAIVRMIIEITKPLRDYLKRNGDDNWRLLFLSSGKAYGNPYPPITRYWSLNYFKTNPLIFVKLEQQFSRYTALRNADFKKFLSRVSLSSIRASAGVLVFLKTQSVEAMAKALGHAKYDSVLLSHYLPDALLEFFQSRWIRIFQKAIIFHAMQDSEYLLPALNFDTLDEVNDFLKNHALKDIPDSDNEQLNVDLTRTVNKGEVLINVNSKILTTLISLQMAVDGADNSKTVRGRARYWAAVTSLVTKSIRSGNDRKLKTHLEEAMRNSSSEKMENLIYAAA